MVNDATLALIKEFEGLRTEAYRCVAGVPTIGYGRTRGVTMGMTIDAKDAHRMLVSDLEAFERAVDNAVTRPMTENQRGAFVSLAYNIGAAAFAKSTAVKRFNAGDVTGAAEAMTWWNKATVDGKKVVLKGLVRRREAERALFMSDVANAVEVDTSPSEVVTGGEAKNPGKSVTIGLGGLGGLVILAEQLGAVKAALPEIAPYLPYVALAVFGFVIVNRLREWRKGEH